MKKKRRKVCRKEGRRKVRNEGGKNEDLRGGI